jgi:hypothetical protein
MDTFQSAVLSWHDFYLAVASAGAALLGLLFVGVSIGLGSVPAADRAQLLVRARQAFANLSLILILSLFLLIPDQDAHTLGFELTISAGVGLVGIAGRFSRTGWRKNVRQGAQMVGRFVWSIAGNGILLAIALDLLLNATQDARLLYWLLWVVFIYLVSAARVSWQLLVQVSRDR